MPPSLHPHLKRGLDFDGFHVGSDDIIEEPPADYEDPEHRAAKRRRIEAIASQYLRGRPPVIITAALRGPFDNGWKNPWAKPIIEKGRTSGKDNAGRHDTTKRRSSSRLKRGSAKDVVQDSMARIASPETSRAARDDLDEREHDDSLDEIEVPPATAPLPDGDDVPGGTEPCSTNTNECIQSRSPMTDPFWLRRPESARVDMRKATNRNTDTSPTRARCRNSASQTKTLAELRLSLPKAPIRARTSAPVIAEAEEWRSSASASMVISSPAKGADTNLQAQATPLASPEPRISTQRTVPIITSSMGSQEMPTRNDAQQSAERLGRSPASKSRQQPQRSSRQSTQQTATPTIPQQDRIASPVPASSTGLVQRKTKLKPRAVNFDSSPEKVPSAKKPYAEDKVAHDEAVDEPHEEPTEADAVKVQACPQVEGDYTVVQHENAELRTSRSSRDSDWCTQAAMMRAQLEFQQSTFPMLSPEPEVLRMDSQPSLDTPRPIPAVNSAAVTPRSAFTVQRDETLAPETVLQAQPSTQDLFGAASPFAFSTVKKKPEGAQRSNLRFALSPSDGLLKGDAVAKSPTPTADRIPLKDKNNTASFWSFITDKASQGSFGDRCKGELNDVGYPALDMDMSLGDLGTTGSLDFTDGFLRNIDDTGIA